MKKSELKEIIKECLIEEAKLGRAKMSVMSIVENAIDTMFDSYGEDMHEQLVSAIADQAEDNRYHIGTPDGIEMIYDIVADFMQDLRNNWMKSLNSSIKKLDKDLSRI